MLMGKKIFSIDDDRVNLLSSVRDDILSVVRGLLGVSLGLQTMPLTDTVWAKVVLIINEFLSNIYKYEDRISFRLAFDVIGDELEIVFWFPGKKFKVQETTNFLKYVDQYLKDFGELPIMVNGKGLFLCKEHSSSFVMSEIKEGILTKEIKLTLKIKEE